MPKSLRERCAIDGDALISAQSSPERRLLAATVIRAINDAMSVFTSNENKDRDTAQQWLNANTVGASRMGFSFRYCVEQLGWGEGFIQTTRKRLQLIYDTDPRETGLSSNAFAARHKIRFRQSALVGYERSNQQRA